MYSRPLFQETLHSDIWGVDAMVDILSNHISPSSYINITTSNYTQTMNKQIAIHDKNIHTYTEMWYKHNVIQEICLKELKECFWSGVAIA